MSSKFLKQLWFVQTALQVQQILLAILITVSCFQQFLFLRYENLTYPTFASDWPSVTVSSWHWLQSNANIHKCLSCQRVTITTGQNPIPKRSDQQPHSARHSTNFRKLPRVSDHSYLSAPSYGCVQKLYHNHNGQFCFLAKRNDMHSWPRCYHG